MNLEFLEGIMLFLAGYLLKCLELYVNKERKK